MNISYATSITALTCYPEFAGMQDVVFNIAWAMTGSDGVRTAEYRGKTSVPFQAGSPFTPYSQLTEQQVMTWLDRYVSPGEIAAAREYVKTNIAAQTAPSTATPPLPW